MGQDSLEEKVYVCCSNPLVPKGAAERRRRHQMFLLIKANFY